MELSESFEIDIADAPVPVEIVESEPAPTPTNLPTRDDPFAIREGKTLTWRNVNMTLSKKKEPDRKLLDGVWGEVPRYVPLLVSEYSCRLLLFFGCLSTRVVSLCYCIRAFM